MLGEKSPAAYPGYTHKFCFRALVPMDKAIAAIGEYRASTRFMYNGPDAHIITYPIGMNTVLNVLAVISDPHPWSTPDGKHTSKGSKQEAVDAFAGWGSTVRAIVDLLPEVMDKWAVFDMKEHPAPGYAQDKICLAGDSAHAVGPHLGCGAGIGIEDALALSTLLEAVNVQLRDQSSQDKEQLCQKALAVYNRIRYERTQELVSSTRVACDLFQWRDPTCGRDPQMFAAEITRRFHYIWDYDIEKMLGDAVHELAA